MKRVNTVFLHTFAVKYTGTTIEASIREMLSVENFHKYSRGWSGFGYSYAIDPQGRVFEGRGLRVPGGHTEGYNSTAYGVALFGHGDLQPVTAAQIQSFKELLRYLHSEGAIGDKYKIRGHREVSTKSCPGNLIYPLVSAGTWNPENVLQVITPTPIPEPIEEDEEMKTIQRIYLELLGRIPSADEATYWEGQIREKGQAAILKAIAESPEGKTLAGNGDWIAVLLRTLNVTAPATLISHLYSGVMTRSDVVSTLLILSMLPSQTTVNNVVDGLAASEIVDLMIDVFQNAKTK